MKRTVKFLGDDTKNTHRPQNVSDTSPNSCNISGLQVMRTVIVVVILLEIKIENRVKEGNR